MHSARKSGVGRGGMIDEGTLAKKEKWFERLGDPWLSHYREATAELRRLREEVAITTREAITSNPTPAAEWAGACTHFGPLAGIGGPVALLCVDCAESYARQQVAEMQQLLESLPTWGHYPWREAAESIRLKLKENAAQIVQLMHEREDARQQVEAFREQVNQRICDACRESLRTL